MGRWWGTRGRVSVGALVLVGGTWWMLAAGSTGVNVANVLATTLAGATIGMTLLDKLPGTGNGHAALVRAAADLAGRVRAAEKAQRVRMLADIGEAKPADLPLRRYPTRLTAESTPTPRYLVHWRDDGGQAEGTLDGIADYYASLGIGRLVVLGAAGSGKTVLLNHLLLALVDDLAAGTRAASPHCPVPVRLSLPTFEPGNNAAHADAEAPARRLEEWIAGHLAEVYGQRYARALALVRGGWILPVLDGLDEMDREEADPQETDPARARAVVRALNHPATDGSVRRVILASREPRYRALAQERPGPGCESVLQDATAVYVLPLAPQQVRDYLAVRFPHPDGSAPDGSVRVEERWQPVLDRLALDPGGALAGALGSPLNLYLAVTGYYQPHTEPRQLVRHGPGSVERELMERYVPAVTLQHPSTQTAYNPQDVRRWLGTLARHLDERQRAGGSGTDLYLHELWRAARSPRPRFLAAAVVGLIVALPLFAVGCYELSTLNPLGVTIVWQDVAVPVCGALLVVVAFFGAALGAPRLRRIDPAAVRTRSGRRALARGFTQGLATGAVIGLAVAAEFEAAFSASFVPYFNTYYQDANRGLTISEFVIAVGLVPGLAFGLASGLVVGLSAVPRRAVRPRDLVSRGVAYSAAYSLAGGIAFDVAFFLASRLTISYQVVVFPPDDPTPSAGHTVVFALARAGDVTALAPDLAFGLAFGFALGLCTSPWPRYAIALRMLTQHGLLPRHPTRFLDWACDAGLLKLSGIAIQFRHQRLQAYLAAPPSARSGPRHAAPDKERGSGL